MFSVPTPAPSGRGLPSFRLLVHGPADGAWNMAVDEALLDRCAEDAPGFPVLRLYSWAPAALSLGRAQSAATVRRAALAGLGVDLVRRPTGGTAVLHDRERTYAVIARLRSTAFPEGVVNTYCRIAKALSAALATLGVASEVVAAAAPAPPATRSPVCFAAQSAKEIVAGGVKLVGSAQLRRRGAFLQHGSILLRSDPGRIAELLGVAPGAEGQRAGLEDLLGDGFDRSLLDRAIVAAFARSFGTAVVPGELGREELERARQLRDRKHRAPEWCLDALDPLAEPSSRGAGRLY